MIGSNFIHPHPNPLPSREREFLAFAEVVVIELPMPSSMGKTYRGWLKCRVAVS